MTIGFICSGNTCRSPMAECMFRAMNPGMAVFSAGLYAMDGMSASPQAMHEMARRGLSLSGHRAQSLTGALAEEALVLCMTESHLRMVKQLYPWANADTLTHYAGLRGDVADPFGGDEDDYFRAAEQIAQALEAVSRRING